MNAYTSLDRERSVSTNLSISVSPSFSYPHVNPVEGCILVLGHHNNHKGTGLVFVNVPSVCSLLFLIQFCEDTLQVKSATR